MIVVILMALVAVAAIFYQVSVGWAVFQLSEVPNLAEAVAQSPLPQRLADLSIVSFDLECNTWTKKVEATFNFVPGEGRAPVKVEGTQACNNSGTLVLWSHDGRLAARENYKPELVVGQVNELLANSGLKKNMGERDDAELAKQLHQQYGKLIQGKPVRKVAFSCDEAGEPYQYAYYNGRERVSKKLKTTCHQAHQNFEITTDNLDAADLKDVTVAVHEYNAMDSDTVIAVYGEFLGAGPVKTQF